MKEFEIKKNPNIKRDKKKNDFNNGIQILRMILSYLILQLHCYKIDKNTCEFLKFCIRANLFYVSTFYIISYYFSYKIINSKNINQIKLRLQRILIPYLLLPIIFFIFNNIEYCFFGGNKIIFKDLFIQFLTGQRMHNVFWFQCNLIATFILFSIIRFLIKSFNYVFYIQFFGICGSIYYSFDLKYHFFSSKYLYEARTLFHDFPKVLFYTSIGITLASIIDINIKIHRKKILFFSIFNFYLLKDFVILINEPFFYLRTFIIGSGSISLFLLFSMIPLDYISNKEINRIIRQITSYTGGVYYFHFKVRDFLNNKFIIVKSETLLGCFLNYIICYILCFFGIKVFGKTKLKYLFI